MATPTVEIMCTEALERMLLRLCQFDGIDGEGLRELRIVAAEVTRARALQRYNNDRQIRLHFPVGA